MTEGELLRRVKERDSKRGSSKPEKQGGIERCISNLVQGSEKMTLSVIRKAVEGVVIANREGEIASQQLNIFQTDIF